MPKDETAIGDTSTKINLPRAPRAFFTRRNLFGPLTNKHGDYALLACSFVTGLLDCSTFNNWSVFVGMQTGNTVILCLSSARLPASQPYSWAATLVSLASFLFGAFVTFRVSIWLGPMRRSVLAGNFIFQGLMVVLAAALTSTDLIPKDNLTVFADEVLSNVRIVGALPPLAFQSGAQIITSRLLAYNELPVNVLTSTYADLMGDKDLFKLHGNVKRNRRLAAVFWLLAGAFVAAWMMKKGPGIVGTLWLGAGIKLAVGMGVLVFMVSKEDIKKESGEVKV
jgi:hypothetical protein